MLASAADGPEVQLWEVATGRKALTLTGHTGTVGHLAFSPDGRRLVSSARDTTLLVWDLTLGSRGAPLVLAAPKRLEQLWTDLAEGDASAAYRAMAELAAAGDRAADLLERRLRPVTGERLRQLLADLDSDQFAVRETASQGLADLGDEVEVALQKLVLESKSAEVRNRAQKLLDDLELASQLLYGGESIRRGRGVQVLEWTGSPRARQVLEGLAGGDPLALRTREARAALERLTRRAADRPR